MLNKPWIENITEDDMPNSDLNAVACFCGIETALILMENYPSGVICIPKRPFKNLRNNYINRNYDGTALSIVKMANICDISTRQIRRILKKP